MIDAAHRATDKRIDRLARRLNKVYGRAHRELTAKVDSFFAKFEKADAKKRALVDAGKLTEKEYKQWRKGQMMMGKHYKELQRQAGEIMLHADREAARYINGELPSVVKLNYNHVGKACESAVKGYSFELVDDNTVQNLIKNHKTLLPYKTVDSKKVVRWNTRRVNAEILQGIIQGESIPKIAKRLAENVTGMERDSAIRNARTAITGAENAGRMIGMQQAQEDGVIMKKEWIATHDSRTRKAHAELNGAQVDIDKPFHNSIGYIDYPGDPHADPANVYNCFVGETNIATDSEIIRSYKHEYQGKLVTIKTSGGVQFTCTPNHPILTLRGWVSAETLQEGDNLAVAFGQKDNMLRINPDINHAFPRIDAIHNFFDKAGGERTCSLSVNFHGDIPASNVEIITKKGLLWRDGYSGVFNGRNKFLLEHSNKSFMGKRTFVKHFSRIWHTTLGRIGSACKSLSLILIGLRHSKVHGLRPVALLDSGRVKPLQNDTSGYTEILSECLHGFSGVVFSDNIISVDFSSERSHVYNLQTENGYYFVNSSISQNAQKCNGIFAIAHNCRCSLGTVVVGFRRPK